MLQISWPSHINLYIGWDIPKSTSHPGASRGCKVAAIKDFVPSKSRCKKDFKGWPFCSPLMRKDGWYYLGHSNLT